MEKIKKKLIIFDADGTIWDSEKDVFLAFNHTLKNNGNKEITKEEFQKLAGLDLEEMFKRVLTKDKETSLANEYVKKYREYYIDGGHYADETTLFENVKETLKKLKEQGFCMVIASGKPKRILDKMVEHFHLNELELVLGTGESRFKPKPDPEILNYIMHHLNVSKEEAVMVGDTKADVMAGKNAGIDTITVTYGYEKIDILKNANSTYMINDFKILEEILEYKND